MVSENKPKKTEKNIPETPQETVEEPKRRIMTVPLPQILDDIENSITSAYAAAKDARNAAEEARQAGEKAASEAARVAAEKIAGVEQIARDALNLAQLLNSALAEAVAVIHNRLSEK